MKEVIEFLKSLNINDEYVIAGISTGPDSMCLLDILVKMNIKVVVAHINHNLRDQSKEEEEYLRNYCKNNNLIFKCSHITSYGKDNFHKEARNFRYNFYYKLAKKYNAKYLMTAHHGDDLIETVLMRINRGSTFKGYAGISRVTKDNDTNIVRPLLYVTKEEITKYLKEHKIKYYIDESNDSDKYTRNRYRKNILPFLKEENNDSHKKFLKFSETIIKYDEFVDKCMQEVVKKIFKNNILYIDKYEVQEELIKERALEYILSSIYKDDITLINDKHLKALDMLIRSSKPNGKLSFPGILQVVKSYDKLKFEFERDCKIKTYNQVFNKKLEINNKYFFKEVFISSDTSNFTTRLLSSEISLPLIIRNKKIKDVMIIKNSTGHKRIKEIFIENKMPVDTRLEYPILVDSNDNILWVPGIKKSKYDKNPSDKYDLIIKYERKEEEDEKK